MTFEPVENFDQSRLPDVNDETSFHDDARYVFEFLSSVVIPGMNAALQWIEAALAGDPGTVIDSVGQILETELPAKLDVSAFTGAAILAKLLSADGAGSGLDADLLDGKHASAFALMNAGNAGFLQVQQLVANYTAGGSQSEEADFPAGIYVANSSDWENPPGALGAILTVKHSSHRAFNLAVDSNGKIYAQNMRADGFSNWIRMWTDHDNVEADTVDGKHASDLQNYNNLSNKPTIGNGTITISAGGGLGGGGNFTVNQTGAKTVTLSHADTSSQGSVNNSDVTFIQGVTLDTYGHVTGLGSATLQTSQISAMIGEAYVQALGSYIMAVTTLNVGFGAQVSGDDLNFAGIYGSLTNPSGFVSGNNPTGTWVSMGDLRGSGYRVGIFKRVY